MAKKPRPTAPDSPKALVRPKPVEGITHRTLKTVLKTHLTKVIVGLLTTGAASGAGITYMKGDSIETKQGKTEIKIESLVKDSDKMERRMEQQDRQLHRVDRRTTRIEAQQELMMDALKVPKSKRPRREMGPVEPIE
jgi:hypothetical protein